jgi:hypothetical protein
VSPLFRRSDKTDATPVEAPETTPDTTQNAGKAYTPSKGRPTPKRVQRRKGLEPPPKDNKEARKRMREKMRAERQERFEGARSGDERYLMPRDQGPVRKLVRDLVDARRNIGPFFFSGLLVVLITSLQMMPPAVQFGGSVLWFGLIVLMFLDGFLIARLVKKSVHDRYPDSKEKMPALYFYAIMRSLSFRRIRNPKPQVKIGDTI